MKSAVLLIAFSRPDTTAPVFEAIRRAKPSRLYVAADGPRPQRLDECQKCEDVRQIVSNVDWPCEAKFLFQDRNLGCKVAVSAAISWFFQHEEEGIILEDDCLPLPSFFRYCDELLEFYRNDERIAQISGSTFLPGSCHSGASYYFTNYADIWGWATWRRAWRHYDMMMSDWPVWRDNNQMARLSYGSRLFERYWSGTFDATHRGEIDTWDFQWLFTCWRTNGLSVAPIHNQIKNIGFGDGATHTTYRAAASFIEPQRPLIFPLIHPPDVKAIAKLDKLISSKRYRINRVDALRRSVRSLPIVGQALAQIRETLIRKRFDRSAL